MRCWCRSRAWWRSTSSFPGVVRVRHRSITCAGLLTPCRSPAYARICSGPIAISRRSATPSWTSSTRGWDGSVVSDVVFDDRGEYEVLIASGRGALIFASHLGNVEVCRALGSLDRKIKINALVHTRHAEKINRLMGEAGAEGFKLWQVTNIDAATALALRERVDQGEWVVIAADRSPVHGGRTVTANLLGAPAPLPIGPYVLASVLGCQVHLMFCLRRGGRNHIYVEPFASQIAWRRRERGAAIADQAQRFARRLEHYVALEPLQWFNFYKFWCASQAGRAEHCERPRSDRAVARCVRRGPCRPRSNCTWRFMTSISHRSYGTVTTRNTSKMRAGR